MGQKVNPHGLRVGIIKEWDSVWYAEKKFSDFLVEDDMLRKYLKKKLMLFKIQENISNCCSKTYLNFQESDKEKLMSTIAISI